jgi:hypothetical protein
MGVYQVCANKSPGGWGGLYTGERPQGHHGPLVRVLCEKFSVNDTFCS